MGPRKSAEEGQTVNGLNARHPEKKAVNGAVPTETRYAADTSGLTPELEKKYRKLFEAYKPTKVLGMEFQAPIVWPNVFGMALLHLFAAYGFFVGAPATTWGNWLFFTVYFLFSGFGVTAGAHRLWTHRSYKAHIVYRIMLMLFNCISMQNDVLEWSRDHRVHHKYSETDADPHNAKRGFFFAHVGWLLMKKHPQVIIKGQQIDMSDLKADPVLRFQHKFFYPMALFFALVVPLLVPWYFWGDSLLHCFCFTVVFRYVFLLHATWLVNSAAHLWGTHPYDEGLKPAENYFVSITAIGEGFHNYHHAFPYDYSTSEFGPFFNVTTAFIDIFAGLGLVWGRKKVSQAAVLARKKRTGELKGLSASEEELSALKDEPNCEF